MADHGVNRRKSHFARRRQRLGKLKVAMHWKIGTRKLKYWWNHWNREIKYDENGKVL